MRIPGLLLLIFLATRIEAQSIPSNEDFVNAVLPKAFRLDSITAYYYLIAGTDTCRFEKFDYDEWVKYHLKETVPLTILNELAYKVHQTHQPYFWQQAKLPKANLITARQADSILHLPHTGLVGVFSFSQPQFTDDGQYAVIDINWKTGPIDGAGLTFLFRHAPDGWRRIGQKKNWGDNR